MKKFMLLAATAALFAACSSEDDFNVGQDFTQPNGSPVAFDMTAGTSTRGTYGSLTTDILKNSNDGFGVFGFYTVRANYAAGSTPNFMYNQQVVYGDGWEYSPLKYWPNETGNKAINGDGTNKADLLSFFAYAPYTKVTESSGTPTAFENNYTWTLDDLTASPTAKASTNAGITALSTNADDTDPLVTFTVPSDPRNQIDLLWGVAGTSTYTSPVVYVQASAEQIAGKVGVTLDGGADASANEMYGVIIYYSATSPAVGAVDVPWATAEQIGAGTGLYTRSTSGVYTGLSSAQVTAAKALKVVDLSSTNNKWTWTNYTYTNVEGSTVTVTGGLPMLNVSKQKVDDKLKFTFRHALSKITFNIDTYVDAEDGRIALDRNTKVYVRAVKFSGANYAITDQLNLNNTTAGTPLWTGTGRVTGDTKPFYFFDGLQNGAECVSGTATPNPNAVEIQMLNGRIIQGGAGVTNSLTNLLTNGGSLMVIPVAEATEHPTIEIVYDVETTDPAMSTKLTDQTKTGAVHENWIKKDLNTLDELTAGKEYIINIHLGLTSAKFDVDINDWQAGGNTENVQLPNNNNDNRD